MQSADDDTGPMLTDSADGRPPWRRLGLTLRQIAAVQYAVHLFIAEDLERGIPATARIYCDGCACQRPRAGAMPYDGNLLCNVCAAQFEVARAGGSIRTVGQFIRDKQFGEGHEIYPGPDAGPELPLEQADRGSRKESMR
jgi:hypothetical protein